MGSGALGAFSGGMSLGSSLASIYTSGKMADIQIDFTKQTVGLERDKANAQRESIRIKRDGELEACDITLEGFKNISKVEEDTVKNKVANSELRSEISKMVSEVKLARMRRDYPVPIRAS